MSLQSGTRLGAYEILDLLGAGGMGEVYRAKDTRLGREVAIKVVRPDLVAREVSRRRFQREALALSRLSHPGIAAVFDVGSEAGLEFLVMELVKGVELSKLVRQGPLPESDVIAIGRQIADAVADAHAAGVIHRDLKPANVLKTLKGSIKILDFGIAQFTAAADDDGPALEAATQTADPIGTLAYMAPEQLRGAAPDARMDVYSMGVLLYELATGVRPFAQYSGLALAHAIVNEDPPAPSTLAPQISSTLESIILQCLEKSPADRWQSAAEIGSALNELQSGRTGKRPRAKAKPRRAELRARDVTSLVALPARLLTADQDAFLAEAISNMLTTQLSTTKGLDVRLPPSSADVERAGGDLAKIANAYGVVACLLSSVTRHDADMTLNAQLAEPRTKRLLWSGEFHGPASSYAALARSASDAIRLALRPAPRPGRVAPTASEPITLSTDADLFYQRGRFHLNAFINRSIRADLTAALSAFDQCLQIDGHRADAAASLAEAYMAALVAGDAFTEIGPLVTAAVDRALAIDPRSSRAWAIRGEIEPGRTADSFRRKLEFALKAATFGPQDAYAHSRLAGPLTAASYELSIAASAQASRLDPLVLRTAVYEALSLSILGRAAEGLDRADYALRIEPDQPFALFARAMALVMAGEAGDALASIRRLREVSAGGRLQPAWINFAADLAGFGHASAAGDGAADEFASRLIRAARGETPFPFWQTTTQGVAPLLARHGRRADAIEVLQFRARAQVLEALDVLLFNPDLSALRADPAYVEVVTAADHRFREMMTILEAARAKGELPPYLERPIDLLLGRLAASDS